MSSTFLLTSLVIVATPGTGVLFTIATGLSRGGRESLVAAAGCTLGPLTVQAEGTPRSRWRVIRTAVLINVLNPKVTIFFFAFLPQFVATGTPNALPRMLMLSGVFMLITFVVFALYGVFAAAMRRHVITRPRVLAWVRGTFAATYVALAGRLALSSR